MSNSVNPDEAARLDLHCLPAELKGLGMEKLFGRVHFKRKGCRVIIIIIIIIIITITIFTGIPIFNANSIDPDQTPHVAAFDQGLHCFSKYFFVCKLITTIPKKKKKRKKTYLHCGFRIYCTQSHRTQSVH